MIRALALRVLREILSRQPWRFKNYAELTIMKALEAHKDPHKEVHTHLVLTHIQHICTWDSVLLCHAVSDWLVCVCVCAGSESGGGDSRHASDVHQP